MLKMSTISRVFLLFCAFHSHHPMEERSKWNTWFVGRVHKVRHTDGHITSLQHLTYLTRIYVSMSQHSYSRCLWKFALRNTCIGKKIAWWAKHQHRKRWSWCFDEHADRGVDSRNGDGCACADLFSCYDISAYELGVVFSHQNPRPTHVDKST